MADTQARHGDSGGSRAFLMGWGGVVAVLLGLVAAYALSPVVRELIDLADRAMRSAGMSPAGTVLALYWFQAIAIGAGFAIVFAGPNKRIDALRGGVGDWGAVLRELLIVAGTVSLWVSASWIWDAHVDEFNTYGNATELPVIGVMVAIPVVAVLIGRALRRQSSDSRRES